MNLQINLSINLTNKFTAKLVNPLVFNSLIIIKNFKNLNKKIIFIFLNNKMNLFHCKQNLSKKIN